MDLRKLFSLPRFQNFKRLPADLKLAEFLRMSEAMGLAARPILGAFTTRVAQICPGFGSPLQNDTYFMNAGIAVTSGTAYYLPSTATSTNWSSQNTVAYGWLRVKIYSGTGTSPTLTALIANLSDATTTARIANDNPAAAYALGANAVYDRIFPFFTGITGVYIATTATLGGTSPGASMDLEVAGLSGSPASA